MEHEEIELEEGEVSNDSDNTYTPLERPLNYSATQPQPRLTIDPHSESEEEFQSSESDSDSDPNVKKTKKPKIKFKPKPPPQHNPKRKKYDIWSSREQDEVLAATLNSCDVTTKDRSRNVEYYDYTLSRRFCDDDRKSNKRTRDDRKNIYFRQRKRSNSEDKLRGTKRIIPELSFDINSRAEDIAKDMANKLCEEKEELILKVINVMGKQKATEIFNETRRIEEEEGGMLIMNQTRRRTPGGVFLYLVRHDYHITLDQKQKIFGEEKQKYKQNTKNKQKEKNMQLKSQIAVSKAKLLPDLLTRAELLACQNPTRKVKDETDETDFVNPPPTPETDGHENSGDGMDGVPEPVVNGSDCLGTSRGTINAYEEDFLDINCSNDMDLF